MREKKYLCNQKYCSGKQIKIFPEKTAVIFLFVTITYKEKTIHRPSVNFKKELAFTKSWIEKIFFFFFCLQLKKFSKI